MCWGTLTIAVSKEEELVTLFVYQEWALARLWSTRGGADAPWLLCSFATSLGLLRLAPFPATDSFHFRLCLRSSNLDAQEH